MHGVTSSVIIGSECDNGLSLKLRKQILGRYDIISNTYTNNITCHVTTIDCTEGKFIQFTGIPKRI